MKHFFHPRLLSALLLAVVTLSAQAHNIWLEDNAEGAVVMRFGEVGEVIEKSPGRLDIFTGMQGWTVATNQFKVEKKADHFAFQGAVKTSPVLAEDSSLAVSSRTNQAPRKTIFYARWQATKTEAGVAGLTLDVVPQGKAGEYRVYFRGQPLAGAKVKVESAHGVTEDLTADAEGKLTFKPSAKGLYLLVCAHRETIAGFAGGRAYEGLNHTSTLSFRQP